MNEALPLPERLLREFSSEKDYVELIKHGRIVTKKVQESTNKSSPMNDRVPDCSIAVILQAVNEGFSIFQEREKNSAKYISRYLVSGDDELFAARKKRTYLAIFTNAYSVEKTLLYIDDALSDCLRNTPYPSNIPVSALQHLPYNSFVMHLDNRWYYVIHDYIFADATTFHGVGVIVYSPQIGVPFRFPAEHDDHFMGEFQENFLEYENLPISAEEFNSLINTLLYIAADRDTVRRVGHVLYPTPKKITQRATSPSMEKALLKEPIVADVGIQFVAALKRYAEVVKNEEGSTESSSKRPHVRRAHPHLYWVNDTARVGEDGKPIKKPVVHYLPPTSVKGGRKAKNTKAMTVQRVE